MEISQIRKLQIILAIAITAVMIPLILSLARRALYAIQKKSVPGTGAKRLFFVTVLSMISIFFLRYGVGLYGVYMGTSPLQWWEELSNSVIHTMQTFGAGENYEHYITMGRAMVSAISDGNEVALTFYRAFTAIMNLVAPTVGGVLVLEILTSVFPKMKLFFLCLCFYKRKFYFSKLNEQSLSLAKSIMKAYDTKSYPKTRPILVFCDVYTSKENEKESELFLGAKSIGAICVREDLAHIPKSRFSKRTYFLIDSDEQGINNVKMLTDLVEKSKAKRLKKTEIFLFSANDSYTGVRRLVYKRLEEEYGFTEKQLPIITPVNCNSNLVCNLLADLPLYEPLVEDKLQGRELELNVSIFGGGALATEMLLSSYWFGQILDCRLNINVFSKESDDDFYKKLDRINPEIRESTCKSPLLVYNGEGGVNPAYCRIDHIECDSGEELTCGAKNNVLLNSQYIFVAEETDGENVTLAGRLRLEVGRYHLESGCRLRTVIAYTVRNASLCKALNSRDVFDFSASDGMPDIYMRAVGAIDDVYSVRNVFCTDYEIWAADIGIKYDSVTDGTKRRAACLAERKRNDDYFTRSSLARAMHIKYKIFSAGLIGGSAFSMGGCYSDEYRDMLVKAYADYKALVKSTSEGSPLIIGLAWLEHRRWNAFMRTIGFRGTTRYTEYMKPSAEGEPAPEHKHFVLKLHPLIVESSRDGSFDRLGEVSEDICRIKGIKTDYKAYDFPAFDFND